MNKEIKALWIEALESGQYQQGRGMLRNEKGEYCCLGVLCELAVQEGVIDTSREYASQNGNSYTEYDGSWHTISDKVREWSGFGWNAEGGYAIPGDVNHVISMNDEEDASFDDIAEWLRRNA